MEKFYNNLKIDAKPGFERVKYMDIFAERESLNKWIQDTKAKSNFQTTGRRTYLEEAEKMLANINRNLTK